MTEKRAKRKHILVISQYFYPEPFRINDICMEWVKRGYRITVLTGIPNYPEGIFYDGYGYRSRRTEKWNGMDIIRIPLIARGNHVCGLAANYLSFVISGFFWNLTAVVKADYVFTFEVSPMTQALIGVWYAKKHRIPNYLYVQDLWPENVETVTGIHHPVLIRPLRKMADYIYRNCTDIFVSSPGFVKAVCRRKIDRRKVHYWPQYAEEFYRPLQHRPTEEIPQSDAFKIIFTGNIGYAQGLDILPKTAHVLRGKKVEFIIVGDGRYLEELKEETGRLQVGEMFRFIPRQPAEKIPELLAACDAAFLSFKDTGLFKMTIPAKLQSYMACGMPVIAAACGETKQIIETAECGICSKMGDADSLASAILWMAGNTDLQAMKINARKYFEKYFEKNYLMDCLDRYFWR